MVTVIMMELAGFAIGMVVEVVRHGEKNPIKNNSLGFIDAIEFRFLLVAPCIVVASIKAQPT